METILLGIFITGYLLITLEHTLKIDKLIPALAMMAFLWAVIAVFKIEVYEVDTALRELIPSKIKTVMAYHLAHTAEILIFLLGAMTIVEIIDFYNGFEKIKAFIRTKSKKKLLWIFAILAFILSAIIDNLTATIVLVTILQKVIKDKNLRLWFAGLIVIAANAGGAWSPIGDVTTTMLWIAEKVSVPMLFYYVFIPSVVCMVVPTYIATLLKPFKGNLENNIDGDESNITRVGTTMLYLGLAAIVFVPVFKVLTGLQPYMGMMLSLAIVATFAEIYSGTKFNITRIDEDNIMHSQSPVHSALTKIELPSILFFLGILMAVAALESIGSLFEFAKYLERVIPDIRIVAGFLGLGSAVIDNVPLVAASIGMFSQPIDDSLWHLIAFAAGTGGSILIIGSAAGVVAMGMEKIEFFWYLKKIGWLAFLGFLAGMITFVLMEAYIL
jgi:Na+/H+ antiporter NhaD/arsenite permease-like protein